MNHDQPTSKRKQPKSRNGKPQTVHLLPSLAAYRIGTDFTVAKGASHVNQSEENVTRRNLPVFAAVTRI